MGVKVGDVVRYATGPTALMQISYIDKITNKIYGQQCMGTTLVVNACTPANAKDMQEWNAHTPWRDKREPLPVGKKIVEVMEKAKPAWPPTMTGPGKTAKQRTEKVGASSPNQATTRSSSATSTALAGTSKTTKRKLSSS